MLLLITFGVFGTAIQKLLGIPYAGLVDDATMIFVVFTVVALLCSGQVQKTNTNIFFFVIFVISSVVSATVNNVPIAVYLVQMRSYVFPLFIVFIFSKLAIDKLTIKFFINIIALVTIILFLSALIELAIGRPILYAENRFGEQIDFDNGVRVFSLIGNPIDFSNFIMLSLCIFFASMSSGLISANKGKLLIVICILCLLLSASRGPIIAALFTFFLYYMHKGLSLVKIVKWSLLSLPFLFLLGNKLLTRFSDISVNYFAEDQYRALYLVKSLEILRDHLAFGVGPGMFGGWVSINFHESEIYTLYNIDTKGISSIDMFWPHFVPEVGLIGCAIFLYPFIKLFKASKQLSSSTNNTMLFISTNVQLLFPAAFLVGLFSISFETQLFSSVLSILCGLFIKVLYDKSSIHSISKR